MRKARLGIEEILKYQRSMVVEVPDDMSDDELDRILDRAQNKADAASDIPHILSNYRIKTIEAPDSYMGSPWDSEVEIDDLDVLD